MLFRTKELKYGQDPLSQKKEHITLLQLLFLADEQ